MRDETKPRRAYAGAPWHPTSYQPGSPAAGATMREEAALRIFCARMSGQAHYPMNPSILREAIRDADALLAALDGAHEEARDEQS